MLFFLKLVNASYTSLGGFWSVLPNLDIIGVPPVGSTVCVGLLFATKTVVVLTKIRLQ